MKTLQSLALVSLLAAAPLTAMAFTPHPNADPDRVLDRMQEELQLTGEQREELEDIFLDHRKEMTKLREDTEKKVNGVLTDEQRKKMEGMRDRRDKYKEMRNKWGEDGEKRREGREGKRDRSGEEGRKWGREE